MLKRIIFTAVCATVLVIAPQANAGQWGQAPAGWTDFKFGLLDGKMPPFNTALSDAVAAGKQIDYSYVYLNTPMEDTGFLFTSWGSYARNRPGNVKPSITVYMINGGPGGGDNLPQILADADSTSFMTSYFNAIAQMADSCKGTNPIYVIEPDCWGYLMNRGGSYTDINDANFSQPCKINNLGISNLSEFNNTMADLPMAIIKTIKTVDPNCYCGLLASAWSAATEPAAGVVADAQAEGALFNELLREPYRGDFIGIEKNGEDAGCPRANPGYMWTDAQNAQYLLWCKTLGQTVNLPLFGWQISIGYESEAEFPALTNTAGSYQDTYFPYFFSHVSDFINAGIIGYDAGVCDNMREGTYASMTSGSGDNGWFLSALTTFRANGPYNLNVANNAIKPQTAATSTLVSIL